MERGQAAERRARLAATLRSNLHRRKAQARERRDLDAGGAPVAPTAAVATPGRTARPILDGDAASSAGAGEGTHSADVAGDGRGEDRA